MPTNVDTLLPSNATALERALEQATARVADVPVPIDALWNPATCPIELLPWLAWALSTDRWDSSWSEDQKRAAVANAIQVQRTKGTPASIKTILASFDELLTVTEWFETVPMGDPYTFFITLPLVQADGGTGGPRTTAAFADAIIHDVILAKPARAHFKLMQTIAAAGSLGPIAAAQTAGFVRLDSEANQTDATDPVWNTYLTTELGEPIELEDWNLFLTVGRGVELTTEAGDPIAIQTVPTLLEVD